MKSQLYPERRPLLFLVVVTAISLPFFVVGAVVDSVRIGALRLPASAVMFLVPVVAAAILVYQEAGRGGVLGLLSRAFDYSAAPRKVWYLAAAGLPVLVAAGAYGIAWGLGEVGTRIPISLVAVPLVVVATLFAAACEELGWTAYATDPLRQRWGTTWTGIGLGIYWALWHLVPLMQVGHGFAWIAGWFTGTVAARVLIVWLHNNTGRGVFAAILFHAMLNVTAVLTPDYDLPIVQILAASLLLALAATVLLSARPSGPRPKG